MWRRNSTFLPCTSTPFDQRFQVGRIVLAVHLGLEGAFVGRVLVLVDGVAHRPQVVAQFALLVALDLEARDGRGPRGQNGQDGDGHDQLDERESPLALLPHWRVS